MRHSPRPFLLLLLALHLLLILLQQTLFEQGLVLPQVSRLVIQRTRQIRITEQALNGQQNRLHVVRRRPFLAQNVQANVAVLVDIRVKAGALKSYPWRHYWVSVREIQNQSILQTFINLFFLFLTI